MSPQLFVVWLALAPVAAPQAAAAPAKAAAPKAAAPAAKAVGATNAPVPKAAPQVQAPPPSQPAPTPTPPVSATPAPEAAQEPATTVPAAATAAPPAASPQQTDWLTQSEAPSSHAEPMQRWPLILATLLLLAAGGAFLALRVRQGQTLWPGAVSEHAIEILAIKALGHKHRLVLVEASGERLLLAATEREVRLLSHISSQEGLAIEAQSDAHQIDTLTRGMDPQSRPAPMVQSAAQPAVAAAPMQPPTTPSTEAYASAYATYMASETMAQAPIVAPAGPASHESLSAEALYEGAARSIDLDEQDEDIDDAQAASPQEQPGALASDVAGLARWRQAAAQGAETWGKQV